MARKLLLVLSSLPGESGTAATQHRFCVMDPENHNSMLVVAASEADATRIQQRLARSSATVWAEFKDAIAIEDRGPMPRELKDKVGLWRRGLMWRPRRHQAATAGSAGNQPTDAKVHAAYAVVMIGSVVAVITAQLYGVFVWLFVGYAGYLVGVFLLSWVLRYVEVQTRWRVGLTVGLPIPVVGLVGFAARGMIHPAFDWSNAWLFLSP